MSAQHELQPLIPDKLVKPPSVTASAVLAMLRRHYLPDETRPAGIFAHEIQAPGPTLRKADLIWLGVTAATGSKLIGHEIKVTRADVLAELADLTKSDPWQRYCDQWWLVIPHLSLIEGLELPPTWGVMTPPSGRRTRSMTLHRAAPALTPAEQAPALKTLAAWVHWRHRDLTAQAKQLQEDTQRQWQEIQRLRIYDTSHRDPNREVIHKIVTGLGGAWGASDEIGVWRLRVNIDDVIEVLKDLGAAYERRDEALRTLTSTRRDLENMSGRIARVLEETVADSSGMVT
jgi:hypothetical protein